jgi:hypothetical protein
VSWLILSTGPVAPDQVRVLVAQDASARHWALKAEVAIAVGDATTAVRALESAASCADAVVQSPWLTTLRAAT